MDQYATAVGILYTLNLSLVSWSKSLMPHWETLCLVIRANRRYFWNTLSM